MAEQGFARLKPKAAETRAPTPSDRAQGDVHHLNSVQYNLAHAIPHLQQAQEHAHKISEKMRTLPQTAPHIQALDRALGGHLS